VLTRTPSATDPARNGSAMSTHLADVGDSSTPSLDLRVAQASGIVSQRAGVSPDEAAVLLGEISAIVGVDRTALSHLVVDSAEARAKPDA
jgi:hypothetical protein